MKYIKTTIGKKNKKCRELNNITLPPKILFTRTSLQIRSIHQNIHFFNPFTFLYKKIISPVISIKELTINAILAPCTSKFFIQMKELIQLITIAIVLHNMSALKSLTTVNSPHKNQTKAVNIVQIINGCNNST